MFPWVSVTNEVFSKCSFQGNLTSYLGIWQLCVMSCQRIGWQVMKNWCSKLPSSSSNLCSYYAEVGHEQEENFIQVSWQISWQSISLGWRGQKIMKSWQGMDHRGNIRVTDNDQVGSHKPFCFWEVWLSHRINDLGHWPHQNKEHRMERNGWCHVRWRSVESQTTKCKDLNLPWNKYAGVIQL